MATASGGRIDETTVARFLRAVGTGDARTVESLLASAPALVNAVGPHPFWGGRPQPLHVAIETRRRDMFDRLLEAGADVDGQNDGYLHWSPLLLAVDRRQAAMRDELLARGARMGVAEALALADDASLSTLLSAGAGALPADVPNDGSLLALARTPAAIDRLLALGVPADARDHWGATPTEAISRLGPEGGPLLRHLMARGVPVEPAAFARVNDTEALDGLLQDDPALRRDPKLLKAAVDFGHHELAARLLDQGADPDGRAGGEADEAPLHSAAWNGDRRMVELLLARGADPRARDRQYDATPAGWAATAVEVTNNPACRDLAKLLAAAEAGRA